MKAAKFLPLFISISILFTMSSCAKKLTFGVSTIVPAATGTVKIKKDKNDNHSIDVALQHLAPSNRLTPPKETYIVWVQTKSNGVKNIGQLNTSNKKLKASLSANLPFKPEYVFITTEDNQTVQIPSKTIVLTTE